jgi:hypothetical protein
MLLLFLSMTLTDAQQLKHDLTEWRMYQRITGDDAQSRTCGDRRPRSPCEAQGKGRRLSIVL